MAADPAGGLDAGRHDLVAEVDLSLESIWCMTSDAASSPTTSPVGGGRHERPMTVDSGRSGGRPRAVRADIGDPAGQRAARR